MDKTLHNIAKTSQTTYKHPFLTTILFILEMGDVFYRKQNKTQPIPIPTYHSIFPFNTQHN